MSTFKIHDPLKKALSLIEEPKENKKNQFPSDPASIPLKQMRKVITESNLPREKIFNQSLEELAKPVPAFDEYCDSVDPDVREALKKNQEAISKTKLPHHKII